MYLQMICLFASSASAMQSLLDVCYECDIDNDIIFNTVKSVSTFLTESL